MLTTAASLAILTIAACLVLYTKLPRRVRKFIEKHSLLTDLFCLIGIYMLLGGTLTALFAAAMCGLAISIMLHVVNHKQDFLFLYDLRSFIREKIKTAKEALDVYGQTYRKRNTKEQHDDIRPMAT